MKRQLLLISITILAAVAANSCRTAKESQVRTEYQTIYQRDSIFVDCTDSVFILQKGDTIFVKEKQTIEKYFYTIYRDTLRQSDTIREVKTFIAAAEPERKKNGWKWFLAGACLSVFIIFAVKLIVKIYLK